MKSPLQNNGDDGLVSRALAKLEELDSAEKLKVLEYLQELLAIKKDK
jgi:hypothetical protein